MMRRPTLTLLALLLTLALGCQRAAAPDDPPAEPPSPDADAPADDAPFSEARVTTLENGLRVVTLEDHSAPLVAVQLFYHVGSKDEQPDRRGFAHMFEHMMFRGSPRVEPEEHMKLIQSVGGSSNAYTSFDETVYIQELPASQLELALWLESERMAFLQIDAEGFATERKVVAEEYHRTAEMPYGKLLEPGLDALFRGHAYAWSPIGSMDELAQARVPELQAFWERYYVPNNAVLVIVGDIQHERALELTRTYFGWIPAYPEKPELPIPPAPPETEPRVIALEERSGPAPIVGVAFRTVPSGHPDERALSMLGDILGGGESSRLYQRLVVEEGEAMIAAAAGLSLEVDGVFGAGAVLSPVGGDPDAVLDVLRAELTRIRDEGVTEAELEKARSAALKVAVSEQLTAASKARVLGSAVLFDGDLERARGALDAIRAVTTDDLQRVARTWLDPERAIEVRVKPSLLGFLAGQLGLGGDSNDGDAEAEEPAPDAPEGARPSGDAWGKPGLSRPENLPEEPPIADAPIRIPEDAALHSEVLESGLRVVVLPNDEVPFVTLSLALDAGAWADPEDRPGVASLTASMLTRGTARSDYSELAERLDRRAISLSASASLDDLSVDASAVADHAPEAFAMLAEVVREPTFPEDALTLLKSQLSTGLAIQEKSPGYLADRALRRALYDPSHPYARSAEPESAELEAISVEELRAWWRRNARPERAVLYVAGDLDSDSALALAREHFDAWRAQADAPATPEAPTFDADPSAHREATRIVLVDHPTEQAQIRVAQRAFTRHHPDYLASRVFSHVFGGAGLSSWLNQSIRVDKGLTYGAYGGFRARRFAGELKVSTFSNVETTADTLRAILEQLERARVETIDGPTLTEARRYLTGDFVLSRETPQAHISDHWLLTSHGLPDDFLTRLLETIQGASAEALLGVAQRHIDPSRLTIVVVGPAEALKDELEAIAPVTVVEGR